MNERDFDKIFGDKLKQDRDFTFTERKWTKMEKHLDNYLDNRRKRRLLWWLALPFLSLLGLTVWLACLLNNTQKELHTLATEVHTLKEAQYVSAINPSVQATHLTSMSAQSDTVYHHIVIRRYDTIFQTIVKAIPSEDIKINSKSVTQPVSADIKTLNEPFKNNPLNPSNAIFESQPKTNKPLSIKAENALSDTNFNQVSNIKKDSLRTSIDSASHTDVKKDTFNFKNEIADQSKAEDFSTIKESSESKSKSNEKNRNKLLNILKPMRTHNYEVGVTGGWAFITNDDIRQQNNFSVGLKGGIGLGKHFKIISETQFVGLDFETNSTNERLGIPTINAPSSDAILQKTSVQQSFWQYSLGLQYTYALKKLEPYVGISALGQAKLDGSVDYLFRDKITGENIFVRTSSHKSSFQTPSLRVHIGATYPILRKWSVLLEGTHDLNMHDKRRNFNSIGQLKSGLLYRF